MERKLQAKKACSTSKWREMVCLLKNITIGTGLSRSSINVSIWSIGYHGVIKRRAIPYSFMNGLFDFVVHVSGNPRD